MFKQVVFFKKRPDMTMEQFIDYYENHHTQLGARIGKPILGNAMRSVRRYLKPERNPVTGEVIDPGYDCVMEIWWNSREDFEAAMAKVGDPERLPHTIEDEKKLFATHSYSVCSVEEYESPVGPDGVIYDWVPVAPS
jgi:hypothetical protein